MNPTIKDIAKACGVSKTTVSRYLNNSGYVSKDVADRIKKQIEDMNYVPSSMARNLSMNTSSEIAVIIPEVTNPFFSEVLQGITELADKAGLNILYFNTDRNPEKELKALDSLRSHPVQGVILTPATEGLIERDHNNRFLEAVEILNVPVVLLDRDISYVDWDGVFYNNFKGAYDCTKLLIEEGHTKIATITGDLSLQIGRDRQQGYQQALIDHGIDIQDDFSLDGDFTTETSYQQMKKLLTLDSLPTAIFSPNNLTTLGILKALFETGLKVPDDIAFVGFDDIELLNILNIHITSAHRDTIEMGRQAMDLLLKKISKLSQETQKIIIEPHMIRRGSEKKL